MQKSFFKGTLQQCHGQGQNKEVSNGQIVCYRSGNNLHVQNLDLGPADIEFDAVKGEVLIKVSLNDGEMLVIQDRIGIAEKKELKR